MNIRALWDKQHDALRNSLTPDEWSELGTDILTSPSKMLELQQGIAAMMLKAGEVGDTQSAENLGKAASALCVISAAANFVLSRSK